MFNYTSEMWYRDLQRLAKKNNRTRYSVEIPEALTVRQYIEKHQPRTEKRTSKKGIELIKVFYSNGTIKEYPIDHIDRTIANDIPAYNNR